MDAENLKFAKRKLRVQRCKNTSTIQPAKTRPIRNLPISSASSHSRKSADRPVSAPIDKVEIPKGNPKLGEELSGLSKEERKRAKASNADRIARRLAKKKSRAAMEKESTKANGRLRSRKSNKSTSSNGTKNLGKKLGGRRFRSDRTVAKRNIKKQ